MSELRDFSSTSCVSVDLVQLRRGKLCTYNTNSHVEIVTTSTTVCISDRRMYEIPDSAKHLNLCPSMTCRQDVAIFETMMAWCVVALLLRAHATEAFGVLPLRAARTKSSLSMSSALIVQNKGGGHGELGKVDGTV